jgi:ATP-dependent protease ClpP protease subunit
MYDYKRPIRRNDDEDDEDEGTGPKPFKIKFAPVATAYKAFVNQPFADSRQFEDLVEVLDVAGPNDVVEIKLTTPGGSLQAVLPVLAAIDATNASVFVHAVSDVASAGTFLLMMADDVYINPHVTIMFHQVTFGAFGQGNHVEDRVQHVQGASKALLSQMYDGFFNPEELAAMFNGKEFWMGKEEFDRRYAARTAYREAAMAASIVEEPPKRQRKKA